LRVGPFWGKEAQFLSKMVGYFGPSFQQIGAVRRDLGAGQYGRDKWFTPNNKRKKFGGWRFFNWLVELHQRRNRFVVILSLCGRFSCAVHPSNYADLNRGQAEALRRFSIFSCDCGESVRINFQESWLQIAYLMVGVCGYPTDGTLPPKRNCNVGFAKIAPTSGCN